MSQVNFSQLIDNSFKRTQGILLKPFSFKKCLKLLWIALLSGALSSGSFNVNIPGPHSSDHKSVTKHSSVSSSEISSEAFVATRTFLTSFFSGSWLLFPTQFTFGLGIFTVVLILGWLVVFLIWMNSHFQFVWFEVIFSGQRGIRDSWRKHKAQGNSLFRVNMLFFLIFLALIAFVFWKFYMMFASILWGNNPVSFVSMIGGAAVFLLLAFSALLVLIWFSGVVYPQLINLMAIDRVSFSSAWNKFWDIYRQSTKEIWIYTFCLLGLAIVGGILTAIAMLIAIVVMLLAGLIIAGPIALLLWQSRTLLYSLAAIFGIPYAIVCMVALLSLCLPLAIFLRAFSLYFLASLNVSYQLLPLADQSESDKGVV